MLYSIIKYRWNGWGFILHLVHVITNCDRRLVPQKSHNLSCSELLCIFVVWLGSSWSFEKQWVFFPCRDSLDRFVADNFPLKSSEFVKGTPRYNDYISAIDKVGSVFHLRLWPALLFRLQRKCFAKSQKLSMGWPAVNLNKLLKLKHATPFCWQIIHRSLSFYSEYTVSSPCVYLLSTVCVCHWIIPSVAERPRAVRKPDSGGAADQRVLSRGGSPRPRGRHSGCTGCLHQTVSWYKVLLFSIFLAFSSSHNAQHNNIFTMCHWHSKDARTGCFIKC